MRLLSFIENLINNSNKLNIVSYATTLTSYVNIYNNDI